VSRLRPQRTRIYFGCEGQSEQSYGKRLNEIADEVSLHLHFDNDVLQPGGGDPLELVRLRSFASARRGESAASSRIGRFCWTGTNSNKIQPGSGRSCGWRGSIDCI